MHLCKHDIFFMLAAVLFENGCLLLLGNTDSCLAAQISTPVPSFRSMTSNLRLQNKTTLVMPRPGLAAGRLASGRSAAPRRGPQRLQRTSPPDRAPVDTPRTQPDSRTAHERIALRLSAPWRDQEEVASVLALDVFVRSSRDPKRSGCRRLHRWQCEARACVMWSSAVRVSIVLSSKRACRPRRSR
jgi:hypothetical protein